MLPLIVLLSSVTIPEPAIIVPSLTVELAISTAEVSSAHMMPVEDCVMAMESIFKMPPPVARIVPELFLGLLSKDKIFRFLSA